MLGGGAGRDGAAGPGGGGRGGGAPAGLCGAVPFPLPSPRAAPTEEAARGGVPVEVCVRTAAAVRVSLPRAPYPALEVFARSSRPFARVLLHVSSFSLVAARYGFVRKRGAHSSAVFWHISELDKTI